MTSKSACVHMWTDPNHQLEQVQLHMLIITQSLNVMSFDLESILRCIRFAVALVCCCCGSGVLVLWLWCVGAVALV